MSQEQLQPNYYWIRVFDYKFERDQSDKGVMLDEFYQGKAKLRPLL